jgi:O-antigen/teichoic acid export membrane protein
VTRRRIPTPDQDDGADGADQQGSLRSQVGRAVAGQAASRGLAAFVTFTATTVLVRYFDQASYGQLIAGLAFGSLFASLNDPGLNQIVLRRVWQPGAELDSLVSNSLGLSLAVSAAGVLVSSGTALLLFSSSGAVTRDCALLSCAGLLVTGTTASYLPLYQARMSLGPVAWGELFSRVLSLAAILLVVATGSGPRLCALAVVSSPIVSLAVLAGMPSGRRVRPAMDPKTWSSLLREAGPVGLSLILYSAYVKIDVILVQQLGTASALAEYGLSYRVVDFLSGLLAGAMVVFVGPLAGSANSEIAMSRRVSQLREGAVVAGGVLVIIGVPTAPVLVSLIGGSSYASAGVPLMILITATAFSILQSVYNTSLVSVGQGRLLVPMTAALLVLNVSANVAVIPVWGASGAAYVTLMTEIVSVIVGAMTARREKDARGGRPPPCPSRQ